ncbi:ABC transporter ATP-binding protein [Mucilaginibacter pedocola]|uniref:ABC transporter domain-containing protein n=1 Tax=Mucilaginibacter pedocola TaxID=1792845 RepID=A0A1S9PGC0_9SPHI|nr:ABC transporter ATP-binding protein [Mucilaginibacter pedocola]OOQ60000.1 hypothetical protein BC343_27100 [Mucilaginibacter pedocola]
MTVKYPVINDEANEVVNSLQLDVVQGYAGLIRFGEKYKANSKIQAKIILLGSEISEALSENGGLILLDTSKLEYISQATKLLFEIVDTFDETAMNDYKIEKVRLSFIDKAKSASVYQCKNITRKLDNFFIHPISFELKLGEITSVVGQNGNGKSTLLKIIAGELGIDEGSHIYPTFSPNGLNWIKIKQQIAYIPQDIREPAKFNSKRDYIHFTVGAKGITGKENIENVEYIIARLGLKKYQDYPWGKLSGGYKLRFELARQLAWNPQLLIMDEPLAHLDIKTQQLFLDDLRKLTDSLKFPMSVILSSQNLYDIESVSDNVIFLNQGKAVYNGSVGAISNTIGYNSFLFKTTCSLTELKNILTPLAKHIKEIRADHGELMLITSQLITGKVLLNKMIESDVAITYFRDTSNSSRIFFENEIV